MSKDITIVLTTMNKPRLLHAMLEFHALQNLKSPFIIIDASDEEVFLVNQASVNRLRPVLSIDHRPPEDPTTFCSLAYGFSLVDTPYALLSGDDDFFLLNTLDKCADFLHNNPTYSACTGLVIKANFAWDDELRRFKFLSSFDATPDGFPEERPSQRVIKFAQRLVVPTYSVQRTDVLREALEEVVASKLYIDNSVPELSMNISMLIRGKLKVLPQLHHYWFSPTFKRPHGSSLHTGLNGLHWYDKLRSEDFQRVLGRYLTVQTRLMQSYEDLSADDCRDISLGVWAGYYSPMMLRRLGETYRKHYQNATLTMRNSKLRVPFRVLGIIMNLSIAKGIDLIRSGRLGRTLHKWLPWSLYNRTPIEIIGLINKSMNNSIFNSLNNSKIKY